MQDSFSGVSPNFRETMISTSSKYQLVDIIYIIKILFSSSGRLLKILFKFGLLRISKYNLIQSVHGVSRLSTKAIFSSLFRCLLSLFAIS